MNYLRNKQTPTNQTGNSSQYTAPLAIHAQDNINSSIQDKNLMGYPVSNHQSGHTASHQQTGSLASHAKNKDSSNNQDGDPMSARVPSQNTSQTASQTTMPDTTGLGDTSNLELDDTQATLIADTGLTNEPETKLGSVETAKEPEAKPAKVESSKGPKGKHVSVENVAALASVQEIPTTDKVVLVMGPTGSGKSTFINYASGGDGKGIGHHLQSYTDKIVFTSVSFKTEKKKTIGVSKSDGKIEKPEATKLSIPAADHANVARPETPGISESTLLDSNGNPQQSDSTNGTGLSHSEEEQRKALNDGQPEPLVFGQPGTYPSGQPQSTQLYFAQTNNSAGSVHGSSNIGAGRSAGHASSTHSISSHQNYANVDQRGTTGKSQALTPTTGQYYPLQTSVDHPKAPATMQPLDHHGFTTLEPHNKEQHKALIGGKSSVSTVDEPNSSAQNKSETLSPNRSHGTDGNDSDETKTAGADESTGDQTIWFVDTPGFDDTYKSDIEILTMIAEFLVVAQYKGLKLDTILYFHRITDNRMAGSPLKNLRLFASLCGNIAMPNVVLVMTMWSLLPNIQIGKARRTELENDFWASMVKEGCRVAEFNDSYESAYEIIFDKEKDRKGILLSKQLVVKHKKLKETEAGITLNQQLEQLIKDKKNANKRLKALSKRQNNSVLKENLEAEVKRIDDSISDVSNTMRSLRLSIPNVFKRFFAKPSLVPFIPT